MAIDKTENVQVLPVRPTAPANGVHLQLHAIVEVTRSVEIGDIVYYALKRPESACVCRVVKKYSGGGLGIAEVDTPSGLISTRPSSCRIFGRVVGYRFVLTKN